MEINKFKKDKNNIYEIEFDDGNKIKLYDDVIIKYNLLINKKLDQKKFKEITDYNDSLDAYYLSVKYINKKLRCAKEIEEFLTKKEFNKALIDQTIKQLTKDHYLDHKSYLVSYINDTFNFKDDGPDKIKRNLNKLGFNDEEIELYLTKDFTSKVKKLIDKKVKLNHKLSNIMLKMNLSNYLINLGYPKEMFYSYLDNIKTDNHPLIKKDYDLLVRKYQNKYENDKLMYFIKDKLYKKGYNSEEISEVLSNELF